MSVSAAWIASGATAAYFALVPLLFAAVNSGLPMWLERLLLGLATPGVLLVLVWMPLLKSLGLGQGEWIVGPSLAAYVLLALSYSAAAGALAWLIGRLLR